MESMLDLIGNTPMLHIKNTNIYAKLECLNPTGSVKDRPAKQMILEAMKEGYLKKDSILVEPTSGNTGIGLAAIGASLGLKVIICMPESMSKERRKLLKAYGAELILTKSTEGMAGAIQKAYELARKNSNVFIPNQFENENNSRAHYLTTGPEIWKDMEENIDILVAGIGTGGTIMGTGKYLKERNPNLKIIGVEPASSPMLTKGIAGTHLIEGIGAGFIPKLLDVSFLDEVIAVQIEDAIKNMKTFAKENGIFVGISSGAALYAAYEISHKYPNKKIAVILPDSGDRYLSTSFCDD